MGSVGNQNPWAPYNDYKDCSQQSICSLNCPQFCYFFFPPPPSSENDSPGPLSPLVIAVIGVLAGAFLLVGYYTVVTRYCKRRPHAGIGDHENNINIDRHEGMIRCRVGLDEALIRAIEVREFRAGDGLTEGTECAVCLTEFREKEPVRILPKCGHAFHLPCIDTWLRSQSSCPLCRAGVVAVAVNVDAGESQRGDNVDLILVIDDDDGDDDDDDHHNYDNTGEIEIKCEGEGAVRRFGRSVSLGAFPSRGQLLVSDVVGGIGSSRARVALKRSGSTGEL